MHALVEQFKPIEKPEWSMITSWSRENPESPSRNYEITPLVRGMGDQFEDGTIVKLPKRLTVKTDRAVRVLAVLERVTAEDVEPETGDDWYFGEINKLVGTESYGLFLESSLIKSPLVRKAILRYLMSKGYASVIRSEEDYVLRILKSGDLELQSYALDVVLEWGDFSNTKALKEVEIKNKYLGGELTEFLDEK